MSLLGVGACPVGSSLAGLGLLVEAPAEARPKLLQKLDGTQGNVSLLVDGDVVVDARAREVGADSTAMKVQLALLTAKDSSAVQGFGLDLVIDVFRPDSANRVDVAVRAALADIVKIGAISIQSVTFARVELTGVVNVAWIDLKTKQLQETSFDV